MRRSIAMDAVVFTQQIHMDVESPTRGRGFAWNHPSRSVHGQPGSDRRDRQQPLDRTDSNPRWGGASDRTHKLKERKSEVRKS